MEILLGILIGVCFTLLGTWFIEYLKNEREEKRLMTAFKNEVDGNLRRVEHNLRVLELRTKQSLPYQIFYTIAYEQLKLTIKLDWEKSELCNSIYRGFALAELYNLGIAHPEDYKQREITKKTMLSNIKTDMQNIQNKLKDYENIKNAVKK